MADIRPFKGILYNNEILKDLSAVATPPYDVISASEQDMFYERNPYNIIRLDKNKPTPRDTDTENPYTRASACFNQWLAEGILVQDAMPAFYLTSVRFTHDDTQHVRYGLVARIGLEPFDKGVILPHEDTFSKVKSERLALMKQCHANFSHIFSIFSDKEGALDLLKSAVGNMTPDSAFTDDAGHHHKMWRITDPEIHKTISDKLAKRRLFIADGHHRYETALNYRQWLRETDPAFSTDHPANFIMMYLCSVQDPGLIIRPTHRLLTSVSADLRDSFIRNAAMDFDVQKQPIRSESIRSDVAAALTPQPNTHKICAFIKNHKDFYILTLKPDVAPERFGTEIPGVLKELDVTVLTRLVLMRLLNFDNENLDDKEKIHFTSDDAAAIDAVTTGTHEMAFILNPPTNEQVRKIAEAGFTMPRKTTFYYPKAVSGQVINRLLPEEIPAAVPETT